MGWGGGRGGLAALHHIYTWARGHSPPALHFSIFGIAPNARGYPPPYVFASSK